MTMPTAEHPCDTCAAPAYLYRMHGTADALCAGCFLTTYPPESALERRVRRSQTMGPSSAGCLRWMRLVAPSAGVHRLVAQPHR